MEFCAREVERNEHVSGPHIEPSVASGLTSNYARDNRCGPDGEEDACAQNVKRARVEVVQDLFG